MSALKERVWYLPPSAVTRPWMPRALLAADEYCNPTLWLQMPFLGALTILWKPGAIRTSACEECQAEAGPWCVNCQSCHNGPRCHELRGCQHDVMAEDCPDCEGWYCPLCESDPRGNCPETS